MSKPKLLYVGHSYHQLTSSTKFLLDLLARNYELSVLWDEGWKPDGRPMSAARINQIASDIVLFFQTVPSAREMRQLRCKRLFLIPMHDHVVGNSRKIWHRVRASRMRVLNFCRATHDIFLALGYESRCVQYWPVPRATETARGAGLKIFFWVRKKEIGWPLLKLLLGATRPDRIVFRVVEDPGQIIDLPGPEDVAEYNIEVVRGWLDKSRYIELLTACNVFVAPRLCEGIGQSFLEAMAYGLAVVAPDSPSMNEYIQHDRNGYLYDYRNPVPINFFNVDVLRACALQNVMAGHQVWMEQESSILDYLGSVNPRGSTLLWRLRSYLKK